MQTFVQWVHLTAAVLGVGGMAFLLFVLLPSSRVLSPEQRDLILKKVAGRFRWISWSVIFLLLASGLYNVRQFYWDAPWGHAWKILTLKIALAMLVFIMVLALTLPLKLLDGFRRRRERWLTAAFVVALIVIMISAYLRRS